MDPVANPYAPGAGTPPPELAGRDELRQSVHIAAERIRVGRPAKSLLLIGLRGVGKTVLLATSPMFSIARSRHWGRREVS
jgi:Cdc6-like AAA superfamily ATPase